MKEVLTQVCDYEVADAKLANERNDHGLRRYDPCKTTVLDTGFS